MVCWRTQISAELKKPLDLTISPNDAQPDASLKFGELLEVLGEAIRSGRDWVRDFENDEIMVHADLLEVIRAAGQFV